MKLLAALALVTIVAYACMQALPTAAWLDETAWPRTTAPLQVATAVGVALVMGGTQAGPMVTVGRQQFWVSPVCSGLRKLVILTATALVLAWALPWTAWLSLLAALLPLTAALNVLRVSATVWLFQHVHEATAVGWWHQVIGLAGYGLGVVGLLAVAGVWWRMRRGR